jgi:hypothetical protein
MLLSTVSEWDKAVMLGLSHLHGITVHSTCIKNGFDWRSRNLNPDLAQSYGTVHVKDRNVVLARQSMLTYYSARRMGSEDLIPTKQSDSDKFQSIHDGVSDSEQNASSSLSLFMMSPGHIQSCYINRNQLSSENILHLVEQVPDAVIPIPIYESVNPQVVNSDSLLPRAQRQAALEVLRRNAELFRQQQEEAESELGDSSDDEDWHDWGEDGDNPSDDD